MPVIKRQVRVSEATQHDSFYDSPIWRKISKAFKVANPYCHYCRTKPVPIIRIGFICDHFLPRRWFPELELDPTNFRCACRECDQRKRQIEKHIRSREETISKLGEGGFNP